MKLPNDMRLTVRLADGSEYPVATLRMKRDGTITRILTHLLHGPFSEWYEIEGADLDRVTLIAYLRPADA